MFKLVFGKSPVNADLFIQTAFYKEKNISAKSGKKSNKPQKILINSHWTEALKEEYERISHLHCFEGALSDSFSAPGENSMYMAWGLGEKGKIKPEDFRKSLAKLYKAIKDKYETVAVCLDSFNVLKSHELSAAMIVEAMGLTSYEFNKYFSKDSSTKIKTIYLTSKESAKKSKVQKAVGEAKNVYESVNLARDYVNEPPNVLNSETYAKFVLDDVKKNLKGVKTKVLGKAELKKEKMNLFLSVNAASKFQPQLVHLTYTPKKATKKTKHIVLVGKGLIFDTGGLSLKPSGAIINMKFDMAGSSTVYGAFRAAVLNQLNVKITCLMGMTDNAVSSTATYPDSIITARNGKTVEILNTDAEGRLVLADCLDYACDLKPDAIIDAATLTGAVLVALGHEICGLFSTDKKLSASLLKAAESTDEYMAELPVIDEFRTDMKGSISDLKNIGGSRNAGSAKAAAFLQEFVRDDIPFAHLDIAGIGDSQGGHLPYCTPKGGSGLIIRSLYQYLSNA